jgi:phospholipase C
VNHTVNAPNVADQLTAANKTWKGYFQSLPPMPDNLVTSGPNANGPYTFKYPSNANALYASKHNPFLNFRNTRGALDNMVPDTQLATDLANNTLPNLSYVVPDQCHDMHGTGSCPDTNALIAAGDSYVNDTVKALTSSRTWEHGRNAIVITWDEDDYSDEGQPGTGCCGANPGGGHVVTIVITNDRHSHHIVDNTPYNHYSLLRTIEQEFGLPYLAHAGDSSVPSMSKLFDTSVREERHR